MKWRLMAALMGMTLLVLLVQDIPLSGYLREVQTDRIITSLERDAFVLAGRSEEALESPGGEQDAYLTALATDYRNAGGARVVIVNADGVAVVTSDDDQSRVGASYASRPEIAAALAGTIQTGNRFSETLGIELLYVAVPVFSGEEVLGAVRLTYPEQEVVDAVTEQLWTLGWVALTTVILAGIVGLIVSTSVTRRLQFLRRTTEQLAHGDLHARADASAGAPEIRSLATSFNRMAGRIEALVDQQRSFAADASHQLRTPLTALRLRLERARELLPTDPAGAAERLADAEAETDRLLTIIEGLLLLNRAEGRVSVPVRVDLAEEARERVEQWRALASELQIELQVHSPVTAPVSAADTAAQQVLDNYLDNAISLSAPGTEVTVTVTVDGGTTRLDIADRGPGLTAEECEHAFERFWRGDLDRGGSGLGLAIVAQLMTASGGTASLAPRPGGGVVATAVFESA